MGAGGIVVFKGEAGCIGLSLALLLLADEDALVMPSSRLVKRGKVLAGMRKG